MDVDVPKIISGTLDRRFRVTNYLYFRRVPGFYEINCLHRRVQRIYGSSSINMQQLQSLMLLQVSFLQNELKLILMQRFSIETRNEDFCGSLNFFDARLLFNNNYP